MKPRRKRTPKQQARFDAATRRAQEIAQDRHRRLEAERIARAEAEYAEQLEAARNREPALDDYWTPAEIAGNLFVLHVLSEWFAGQYGSPEVFN
jgi:hypothetical protein